MDEEAIEGAIEEAIEGAIAGAIAEAELPIGRRPRSVPARRRAKVGRGTAASPKKGPARRLPRPARRRAEEGAGGGIADEEPPPLP